MNNETLNDPTRSGPPLIVEPGKTLQLSRNEIESRCTKAARGAGMSWGLAEEAGYAAGWLASRGLDGAGVLATHLRSAQGESWQDICPVVEPGEWHARTAGQSLCPIALGATLSDHVSVDRALFDGHGLRVGEVNCPGLVLPFIAMAREAIDKPICVRFYHDVVRIGAGGTVSGDVSALLAVDCGALVIAVDESTAEQGVSKHESQSVPAPEVPVPMAPLGSDALTFLNELSLQTTVPSSAASRANAGAVGSDND